MSIKSSRSKKKVTEPSTIIPSPWDHSNASRKKVQAIRTQQSSVEMQMNEDIEHSLRQSINTNRSDRNNSVRKSVTGKQTGETKSIEESPRIDPVRLNSGNREFKANESTHTPSKETSRIQLDTKRSTLTQREMINVQS